MMQMMRRILAWGPRGGGVVTENLQILIIVVVLLVLVAGLLMVMGGGIRGVATLLGTSHNQVAGAVSTTSGGFTNPFRQGSGNVLLTLFNQVFP